MSSVVDNFGVENRHGYNWGFLLDVFEIDFGFNIGLIFGSHPDFATLGDIHDESQCSANVKIARFELRLTSWLKPTVTSTLNWSSKNIG